MVEANAEQQEPGGSTGQAPTTTTGSSALRGGIRRSSAGFEGELRGYLQGRLRIAAAFIVAVAGALYVVDQMLVLVNGTWSLGHLTAPARLVHAVSLLGSLGIWLRLRGRQIGVRELLYADLVLVVVTLLTCTGIYFLDYKRGMASLPGLLALVLVARALVVPSTMRRTLLYSAPAPLLFLGVKLVHGQTYGWLDVAIPDEFFLNFVIWEQCTLWLGVGMAALASKVNYSLRVEAWRARQIDQYEIEGRLGSGGQGEVYRARHALMKRPTAIKVVHGDAVGTRTLKRFEKEVRQTSRLSHPNTIRIFDYGRSADGTFYYAMELLDGADLDCIVESTGPMPPARVIHVMTQTCAALHEAHEKGLVHRDVKAGNIVLCRRGLDDDVVKVMDFGLVKDLESDGASLTHAGEICGSPHTIAPEVLRGEAVTRRSDLYSLAAVGFYLLTGRTVFEGNTVVAIASAHLTEAPTPPSALRPGVPDDLEAVLLACLAKDPEDRPRNADALREALLRCRDAGGWDQTTARAWWTENRERVAAWDPHDALEPS